MWICPKQYFDNDNGDVTSQIWHRPPVSRPEKIMALNARLVRTTPYIQPVRTLSFSLRDREENINNYEVKLGKKNVITRARRKYF